MTTVKNALTILKSKCFISKIEVNIKYIGSRNRALYASAAQESVYVHVGVSVCFGSLFAFVCFVWVFFFCFGRYFVAGYRSGFELCFTTLLHT